MAEQWYSIVEYAREFAVSDMTVRRRIKTGRLSAVLRDGKYYIPVSPDQAAKLRSGVGQNIDDEDQYAPASQASYTQRQVAPPTQREQNFRRPNEAAYAPNSNSHMSRPQYATEPRYHEQRHHAQPVRHQEISPRRTQEFRPTQLIPGHILAKLEAYDKSLVDTKALLDFCEHTVGLVNKVEIKLQEQFEAKMHSLQTEVHSKNMELNQLQQQVEDLQVLVKILERKSIT